MGESKTTKLFKGVSVQTASMLIMGVLEIVMFSIWSRLLSKDAFGHLAAISGVMAIFTCISEAGLGAAIIQKKDESNEHVSTAFTLSCLLGFCFSCLFFLLAPILANLVSDSSIVTPMRLMSVIIFTSCVISVGQSILIKKLQFLRLAIILLISYVSGSVIGILMAKNGFGLYAIITSSIINSILTILLIFTTSVKVPKFGIYKNEVPSIVNFGGWLTIGALLNTFTQKMDSLLLSRLLSVKELGAYNRPAGFVNQISMKCNSIFDTVLFPLLSDIQKEKDMVQDVFLKAIALLNSFSIILALLFFFNAELIITIFFGSQWIELVPIMRIISISVIFNIDGRLVDIFFRSLALVKIGAFLRAFQTIVTIVGIVLGSHYGLYGVATSIVITNIITIFVKLFVLIKNISVSTFEVIKYWFFSWKPSILILIISIPYMYLSHTLLLNVLYAICFAILVIVQFFVYPKMVGREYNLVVGPYLANIKTQINNTITNFLKKDNQ